jgi:hypothetical protein
MLRSINSGVTTIKPGHQTTGNVHVTCQTSRLSHCSLHQEEFIFGEEPSKPTIRNVWLSSNSEIRGRLCDALGSNIMVQYFVGPIITLHGQITVREYMDKLDNQVHPMIQTLYSNNDAVFKDDNAPIHTTGTLQSWFEEHEGELQHLSWPAQSPDLNITEPLWSVFENRVMNRFLPATFVKCGNQRWCCNYLYFQLVCISGQ